MTARNTTFPYDLVTLGHFENGWGWEGQLRSYIRKKYRADLDGLAELAPEPLAACLGADLVPEKPYDTIRWGLRLRPFRPLELFFFYNLDPEFGADVRVLFSCPSLAVPTEDAYVFAWDYLALLARYGKGAYPLSLPPPQPGWVPLADLNDGQGGVIMERFTLQGRLEIITQVSAQVAATAILRLDRGTCEATPGGWTILWSVLPDLQLRAAVHDKTFAVAFDAGGAAKYAPDFLYSFAWLYLNALLRQARQVDPDLPQLSSYF